MCVETSASPTCGAHRTQGGLGHFRLQRAQYWALSCRELCEEPDCVVSCVSLSHRQGEGVPPWVTGLAHHAQRAGVLSFAWLVALWPAAAEGSCQACLLRVPILGRIQPWEGRQGGPSGHEDIGETVFPELCPMPACFGMGLVAQKTAAFWEWRERGPSPGASPFFCNQQRGPIRQGVTSLSLHPSLGLLELAQPPPTLVAAPSNIATAQLGVASLSVATRNVIH